MRAIEINDATGRRVADSQPELWPGVGRWQGLPVGGRQVSESADFGPCGAPDVFVQMCFGGEGHWTVRSGARQFTCELRPRSIAINPRNFDVDGGHVVGRCDEIIGMQFPHDMLSSLLHDEADGFDAELLFSESDPTIASLLTMVRNEVVADCPSGAMFAQGLSMALIGHLRARFPARRRDVAQGKLNAAQLSTIVDYMNANLDRDVSVPDLAALLALSPVHFTRRFRASTGLAPYRYLLRQRIERATSMMATERPLAEIALSVGMGSQSHFTQVFRQFVGVTPGRMREEMHRKPRD